MTDERYSEAMFERLVTDDPARLVELLKGDQLQPAMLTFAAEIAGKLPLDLVGMALCDLLKHLSALVREGAVYGLGEHRGDVRFSIAEVLRVMATDDPSPGVRAAAGGAA